MRNKALAHVFVATIFVCSITNPVAPAANAQTASCSLEQIRVLMEQRFSDLQIKAACGEGETPTGQASSRRLKKDIQPLSSALQTVLGLEGVRFRWKKTDEVGIGFIAEDAGKLIPEAVTYEEDGRTTSGMSYTTVIPFLVEAIKEQSSTISMLREQVDQLSKEVKER